MASSTIYIYDIFSFRIKSDETRTIRDIFPVNLQGLLLVDIFRYLYPCIVTLVVMTTTFPDWLGHFMGGKLTQKDSIQHMFRLVQLFGKLLEYTTHV